MPCGTLLGKIAVLFFVVFFMVSCADRNQGVSGVPANAPASLDPPDIVNTLVGIPGYSWKIMRYEVTFDDWDACVADGGCDGYRPDDQRWGRGKRPVIHVNYDNIQIYIAWLNKKTEKKWRLPTEEEWEYAARGGASTDYWWGNTVDCSQARYGFGSKQKPGECGNTFAGPLPVGSFQPNAYGLYDTAGNVWEWTSTCWEGDCSRRVVRGGAFTNPASVLRASYRLPNEANTLNHTLFGFRLIQEP